VTACFHKSPDEAVLAPLVAEFTRQSVDPTTGPEYVVFADQLTAKVFESLSRDPHYRIVPAGQRVACPASGPPCPRRYQLSARVNSIVGDTAVATTQRFEADSGGHGIAYEEQILLVRRNGKWKIEKILGYSAIVPG
jgi:hypothetical protein